LQFLRAACTPFKNPLACKSQSASLRSEWAAIPSKIYPMVCTLLFAAQAPPCLMTNGAGLVPWSLLDNNFLFLTQATPVVIAGQQLFVFDTGNTSARNINKMGFNAGNIQGIFLTHFHSDHIDGLGELLLQRWVSNSNTQPVPVHGPEGVETVVNGFMQAYSLDRGYRVAHHGEAIVPSSGFGAKAVSFKTQAFETMLLYDSQDTKIHAFSVAHAPIHPAVGYKIQYKDRSIVISGDTTPSVHVAKAAQGVDVLIHEAMSMELMKLLQEGAKTAKRDKLEQIMKDITDYHTSPVQAAEIAQQAQVSYLLLNHIAPPLPLPGLVDAFLKGTAEVFKGKIQVAKDGNFLSLPAGKKSIDASHRF